MDLEIALVGMVGLAALSGAAGVVWGRGTVAADVYLCKHGIEATQPREHETPLALMQLQTMASGHVHEGTTFDNSGWHCECGQHLHVYTFAIEDSEDKRCVCGATGTGKEWS